MRSIVFCILILCSVGCGASLTAPVCTPQLDPPGVCCRMAVAVDHRAEIKGTTLRVRMAGALEGCAERPQEPALEPCPVR